MEIKLLHEKDYIDSIKLSEYAFQYKIPEADIESRKEMLKKQRVFGIWDKDALAAKLHLLSLKIFINGVEWAMGGVAGVATYPEYRRNGYVRELLVQSLKDMHDHGQIVSMLHPFDIGFYRKYGWEIFSEYKSLVFEKPQLNMLSKANGRIKRYTKETHIEEIENVYKAFSKSFNGMLARDKDWWMKKVYHDSMIAGYWDEGDTLQGYMLYSVKDKKMDVQEFVVLNHEARRGLWNFICQHDSMVEKVKMLLSPHDLLSYSLSTPKVQTETYPYFMARIVNVEECLSKLAFNKTEEKVFIHLEDDYAPWNNGSYLISETGVKVFKEKVGAACVHPPQKGVTMNINQLTAIVFGYKRPLELLEIGVIHGSKEEVSILERMLPSSKSFFYDFF